MNFSSERRLAAYDALDKFPGGKYARDLAVIMEKDPKTISRMLCQMKSAGMIESIREPGFSNLDKARVRYYLKKHEKEAMKAHEESKGVTWGMRRNASQAQQAAGWGAKRAQSAKRWNDGKLPEPVKWPHGVDHRFTVKQPEPFFSRPDYRTNSIGQDTWTARVYGQN